MVARGVGMLAASCPCIVAANAAAVRTSSGGSSWDISGELEVVHGRDAAIGGGARLPWTR
jgi:hypothetical protein